MASKSSYLDNNGVSYLWEKVKKYITNKDIRTATPVGGSIDWYGPESTIPSDWMREDGRNLSKTQYPELFAIIGYTYGGSGDNFNIPNSKGRVNVHLDEDDNNFKTLGNKYGWKNYKLLPSDIAPHNHNVYGYPEVNTGSMYGLKPDQLTGYGNYNTGTVGRSIFLGEAVVQQTYADQTEHPNVQPSIVSYRIIKVKEDAASRDLRLLDEQLVNHIKYQHGGITLRSSNTMNLGTVPGDYTITNVPFNTATNTNEHLFEFMGNGKVKIKKAGYYKVSLQVDSDLFNPSNAIDLMRASISVAGQIKVIASSTTITSNSFTNIGYGSMMVTVSIPPIILEINENEIVSSNIDFALTHGRELRPDRSFMTIETI